MSQWDCNEERVLEHAPLDECIPSLLSVSPLGKWSEWGGKTLESGTNWDTHTHIHRHSFSPKKHRYQKCNGAEGKRHLIVGCTVTAAVKSSRWTAELRLCWLFHYTVPRNIKGLCSVDAIVFLGHSGLRGWLIFTQESLFRRVFFYSPVFMCFFLAT